MANEKRLIDANALIAQFSGGEALKSIAESTYDAMFVAALRDAPTVDAVEVVRCKDCAHWHQETGWCNKHSHFIGAKGEACHPWESSQWKMLAADDFCSWGERRADDG